MITWLDSDTAEYEELALEDLGLPGDLVSERTCRFKKPFSACKRAKALPERTLPHRTRRGLGILSPALYSYRRIHTSSKDVYEEHVAC